MMAAVTMLAAVLEAGRMTAVLQVVAAWRPVRHRLRRRAMA